MKKTLLIILMTAAVTTSYAETHLRDENKTMTTAERAEWKENLAMEAEKAEQEEDKKPADVAIFFGPASKDLYTTHPASIHFTVATTMDGAQMTLHDGSVWKVRFWDRHTQLSWLKSDELLVVPNTEFFSLYDYVIVNRTTGQEIYANLFLDPIIGGPYTYQIIGFNDIYEYVYLNDGSVWSISPSDHHLYHKWMIGDLIIIGTNSGWDRHKRPDALINCSHDSYIRAACIQ